MPDVIIIDEVVVALPREIVARRIAQPQRWTAWWPDADVTVTVDRGVEGMAWSLAGTLVGVSEVVLAVEGSGVRIHYELRADPARPGTDTQSRHLPDSPRGRRRLSSLRQRQLIAWQRTLWALRDELET